MNAIRAFACRYARMNWRAYYETKIGQLQGHRKAVEMVKVGRVRGAENVVRIIMRCFVKKNKGVTEGKCGGEVGSGMRIDLLDRTSVCFPSRMLKKPVQQGRSE
jgi:hypothetical protein